MAPSIFRSPVFWGGVGVIAAAVGVTLYRKRSMLLGRGPMGPEPVLITRNPAKMPVPVETQRVGGMTLARYEMARMSIDERLKLIQKNVWAGINDPRIRHLAGQLTKNCGRDEGDCEIRSIFDAVKARVRYSGDVGPVVNPRTGVTEAVDLYQSPWRSWEAQVADCDDHVALIVSLLAVIGHEARLRVTAPAKFGEWSHVYPVVGVPKTAPKTWKAVDVTLPWGNSRPGSEARYAKARDYVVEVPA